MAARATLEPCLTPSLCGALRLTPPLSDERSQKISVILRFDSMTSPVTPGTASLPSTTGPFRIGEASSMMMKYI